MKIAYIISLIILFIMFILIKKTEKKQNVLFWIMISATILIPYNVLSSYILSIMNIKNTLIAFSIINVLVSILLIVKTIFDKNIQKYYIKVSDSIFLVILLAIIMIIANKQYGSPLKIKYETTDPGVHYEAAKTFYEEKYLLYKVEKTTYYDFEAFMPAAYVNTGIMMDLSSDILNPVDMYQIYILFDLIILYLIGAVFYFGITNIKSGKINTIIAMILSVIFIIGYPLNSMIWGFAYLSVGILIITGILATARLLKDKEMKISVISVTMFLLLFGLFFSYYLFVPVVYSALGIYMLIDIIKNRKEIKIFSKSNIVKVIVILVLPTILGFIYFVLPGMVQEGTTAVSAMSHEGYIYRDLYMNFIPFAPFLLFYIIYTIKERKNSFSVIFSVILLIFILITFIGGMKGKVSSYYYFKSYFALWIISIYCTYRAICKLSENKDAKIFVYVSVLTYLLMSSILFLNLDQIITDRNVLFNPAGKSSAMLDIQYINKAFIGKETEILNKNQIEGIKYCNEYLDKDQKSNVIVYGEMLERIWVYVLTDIKDSNTLNELYECPIDSMNEFLESDKKYLLYIKNDDSELELEIEEQSNIYSILYSNENFIFVEKNI